MYADVQIYQTGRLVYGDRLKLTMQRLRVRTVNGTATAVDYSESS